MTVLRQIYDIMMRELLILRRNHIYRFCMVVFPLLVIFFFTSMLDDGVPTGLPVGIVDQDNTSTSRALCRKLDGFQTSRIYAYYPNVSEARRAIQRNEIYGFLYIPKGTTEKLLASRQPRRPFLHWDPLLLDRRHYVPKELPTDRYKRCCNPSLSICIRLLIRGVVITSILRRSWCQVLSSSLSS